MSLTSADQAESGQNVPVSTAEKVVRDLLELAGLTLGGSAPRDIKVHDERFFARVLQHGSLGFGETYIDGWWDSRAIDQTVAAILAADLPAKVGRNWKYWASVLGARLINLQSRRRAPKVAVEHYDIGNDLYRAMLDPRLVYTCAYFKDTDDLAQAQEAKLDLVCRKIELEPGMRVLDLGCGFGSFARFAAERYGAHVTGVTLSRQQLELGRELSAGLPVELYLSDYRETKGTYDRVVSIGLLEHVGSRNYRTYMQVVDQRLAPGGLAFFHTIATPVSHTIGDPWITRYIFPNSNLPSLAQLGAAMERLFVIEDLHEIGPHYDPTLMAWHANYMAARPGLAARYDERFHRMWVYYLLMCAATFRTRYSQVFQVVMSRPNSARPDCRKS